MRYVVVLVEKKRECWSEVMKLGVEEEGKNATNEPTRCRIG